MAIAVVASLIGAMMPTAGATPPDEVVYLSLGTSLAAGSMADPAGDTTFSSSRSYTDQLYQRVTGRIGTDLAHVQAIAENSTLTAIQEQTFDARRTLTTSTMTPVSFSPLQ